MEVRISKLHGVDKRAMELGKRLEELGEVEQKAQLMQQRLTEHEGVDKKVQQTAASAQVMSQRLKELKASHEADMKKNALLFEEQKQRASDTQRQLEDLRHADKRARS